MNLGKGLYEPISPIQAVIMIFTIIKGRPAKEVVLCRCLIETYVNISISY